MKRLALAVALLSLSGCGEFIEVCRACLKSDPERPVATADLARIRVVRGNAPLPAGATNVFYREQCGIDCMQWLRFDAEPAAATQFAARLLGKPPAPGFAVDPGGAVVARWWPSEWPADAKGGEVTNDPRPATVVLAPAGRRTRVWVRANET